VRVYSLILPGSDSSKVADPDVMFPVKRFVGAITVGCCKEVRSSRAGWARGLRPVGDAKSHIGIHPAQQQQWLLDPLGGGLFPAVPLAWF